MNSTLWVHRPVSVEQAVALMRESPHARVVGGGTEIVALTRSGLMPQAPLLTMRSLGLERIDTHDGRLVIGAGARMADVAGSALALREAPALAQALLASASPQVRNVATLAGNLLQRTRCPYYRGLAPACNKIKPGSGCAVRTGDQRQAAIFGTSLHCHATHASDLAVALLALDAQLVVHGANDERRLAIEALHSEPSEHAEREHTLADGELITAIELPLTPAARASVYVKVRDRASFQFALVSLAVALEFADGKVTHARLAAGGVGSRPWRLRASEAALVGQAAGPAPWRAAALAATQGADALPGNAFKLELLQRTVEHTLAQYTRDAGDTSESQAPARVGERR